MVSVATVACWDILGDKWNRMPAQSFAWCSLNVGPDILTGNLPSLKRWLALCPWVLRSPFIIRFQIQLQPERPSRYTSFKIYVLQNIRYNNMAMLGLHSMRGAVGSRWRPYVCYEIYVHLQKCYDRADMLAGSTVSEGEVREGAHGRGGGGGQSDLDRNHLSAI